MSGHTPGPWIVVGGFSVKAVNGRRSYPSATSVCSFIPYPHDGASNDEARANAALTAAAPDLLTALRELMTAFGGVTTHPQQAAWDVARAAIAKAEGRG